MKRERVRKSIDLSKGGRTKQGFKDEGDINQILAKYQVTGVIQHVKDNAQYIDCPTGLDFHAAQNLVLDAEEKFAGLPSTVRKEFRNDPREFLTFVEDPENVVRMAELGLIEAPEVEPEPIPETEPEPATTGGETAD